MAVITLDTVLSNSIDIALATGELRTKTNLVDEFRKEYQTYAYTEYDAFDKEMKILMSKIEADASFLIEIFKNNLAERLTSTKEQAEAIVATIEKEISLVDANIIVRKKHLSEIEKFRAYVAKEEGIAKKKNIDFGMLLNYAKTTAGYMSYVLTVAPEQLTNTDPTSPLTRFKAAKDEIKNLLLSFGYNGVSGCTVLNPLKTIIATMPTTIPTLPSPLTVTPVTLTQDTISIGTIQEEVLLYKNVIELANLPILDLASKTVHEYFVNFGIDNTKRADSILAANEFHASIQRKMLQMILSARETLRKEAVGRDAKLAILQNEISKKLNDLELKKAQQLEAEVKITAGIQDIHARVAAVQNFYDNLLRQGTEILGSYANSVVSSVPTNAASVVAEFKEFLDMAQKEIDVRI